MDYFVSRIYKMLEIILKIVNVVTGIRVSENEERTGLDIVLHEERGYDM